MFYFTSRKHQMFFFTSRKHKTALQERKTISEKASPDSDFPRPEQKVII